MHDRATIGRFIVVGVAAALLFFLLVWLFIAAGLPPFAGGTLAYAIVFAAAYLTQRGWSFRWRHGHGHALPRYAVAQAFAAVMSGAMAQVATSVLGWPVGVAALLAACVASAASLLLSLFWVFPARPNAAGD